MRRRRVGEGRLPRRRGLDQHGNRLRNPPESQVDYVAVAWRRGGRRRRCVKRFNDQNGEADCDQEEQQQQRPSQVQAALPSAALRLAAAAFSAGDENTSSSGLAT